MFSAFFFFLSEPPPVGDAIFGVVGHPKAIVLAWTIHDLVALLLLIANEPALCACGHS